MTPRFLRIGLAAAALAAGLSAIYLFDLARRVQSSFEEDEEPAFQESSPPLYEPTDPEVEVRIFFPAQSNDLLLRSRDVTIFGAESPEGRLRQILEHLITGTGDPLLYGRLPEGTRLNQVFISPEGTAYLDFTSALSENHPGGILAEQATLYAIVDSLAYNLPEVERVKILIGGAEKETLAGHVMLILPLEPDYSISDFRPPEPI